MMISPETFGAIASGQRRDLAARATRCALHCAELPYYLAMQWRNRKYDRQPACVTAVEVPVVSVGNITTGGTGKTPFVAWLARWFRQGGVRVSLVSRGYARDAAGGNDEARELELQLPDVPHVQDADRIAAARIAIDELETQLILLDDGFQHRRIARDLDIVLIDAKNPFGYGHLLPRGLLRESLAGLRRADCLALTRANLVSESVRESIRRAVHAYAPQALWLEVVQRPAMLCTASGQRLPLSALPSGPLAGFCGIGNPVQFRRTMDQLGWPVKDVRVYPDHYAYGAESIVELSTWVAQQPDIAAVICTQKDLVKVATDRLAQRPLFALSLETEIPVGLDRLEQRLRALMVH